LEKFIYPKTTVHFSNPKNKFFVNYEKIAQKIKEHFIAYFKISTDNKKDILIKIFENDQLKLEIKSSDIPNFNTKSFRINSHNFIIDYVFNDSSYNFTEGYYCAGERVVIKNSLLDTKKKFKAYSNINILFLLSSKYLDENVNATRDDFTIMPKRTNQQSMFQDISWKDIQDELKKQIKVIAKSQNIDIDSISSSNLKQSIKEAPFLAYYLQDNEEGFDCKTLIENAKEKLDEDKELIRSDIDNNEALLSIVTQSELTEYIFDRQRKINLLKKLTNEKVLEKEIHNLFMMQGTTDSVENYKSNNLWLFDDRFMTYDKVFSEIEIRNIFPELLDNVKRPDIISIVSNTYDKDLITDIVVIELKRPNEIITPEGAEAQLLKYSRYINQSNIKNKIRIWTYAFLKFNDDINEDLDDKDYNKIPTHWDYPIYYKYHKKRNTIINFMDYRALAYDADTRNKTFMKILNGDSLKNNQ